MPDYAWIEELFSAQQVGKGGIVRRQRGNGVGQVNDAMLNALIDAAKARNFHVIETGNQVVVLCHEGDFRIWC